MAADATAGGNRRHGADLLLPALAVVCGLQAWRAVAVVLAGWLAERPGIGGAAIGVAAVVGASLLVPAGLHLARRHGTARVAAGAAMALAAMRLAAQVGGPATVPAFAFLGAGCFAGWCTLWAAVTPPRSRLSGLLLGLALAAADLGLAVGYDLIWRPGTPPLLGCLALCGPLAVLATWALRAPGEDPPRPVAVVLGLPLVAAAALAAGLHPARLSSLAGCSLRWAMLLLVVANTLTVPAAQLARNYLRTSLAQGAARVSRERFAALYAALTLVCGGCLLMDATAAVGILLVPLVAAFGLVPLYEAWPVGRRHRGAVLLLQATWLLAGLLVAIAGEGLWPVALALAALFAMAAVALRHLPDDASSPPVSPTSRLVALPLLVLLPLLLRPPRAPAELYDQLPAIRVVSLDVHGGRGRDGRPGLHAQLAYLRELRPQLVLLRGARGPEGLRLLPAAEYLADQLGLRATIVPDEPDMVYLAPTRPDRLIRPAAGAAVAFWQAGDRLLSVAQFSGPVPPSRLRTVMRLMAPSSYRLVAGDVRPDLGSLLYSPSPWRDVAGRADGPRPLLLAGGYLTPLAVDSAPAGLSREPVASALVRLD